MKNNTFWFGLGILLLLLIAGCSKNTVNGNNLINEGDTPIGNIRNLQAPDFTVKTTDGNTIKLSELTAQNKPVLVYFMATWCPYCRQDLASVNRVYPKYKEDVEFIAIDLDLTENAKQLKNYKERGNYDFTFALGNPKVLTAYGVRGTTGKFAVGRDGILLYTGYGVLQDKHWETIFGGLASS